MLNVANFTIEVSALKYIMDYEKSISKDSWKAPSTLILLKSGVFAGQCISWLHPLPEVLISSHVVQPGDDRSRWAPV